MFWTMPIIIAGPKGQLQLAEAKDAGLAGVGPTAPSVML